MLVPHLLKIYFGLGLPSSVFEIVSSQRLKTNYVFMYATKHFIKSCTHSACTVYTVQP